MQTYLIIVYFRTIAIYWNLIWNDILGLKCQELFGMQENENQFFEAFDDNAFGAGVFEKSHFGLLTNNRTPCED